MRFVLASMIAIIGLTSNARAALKTQTVEYNQGVAFLEGYLVYDDAIKRQATGDIGCA